VPQDSLPAKTPRPIQVRIRMRQQMLDPQRVVAQGDHRQDLPQVVERA